VGQCAAMDHATPGLSSTFKDLNSLSQDLGTSLLFDCVSADVVLRCQDERIPAHRAILGARSPVFRAMFYGAMKESSQGEVAVNGFGPATMRVLLRFMYSGRVDDVRLEEMVPLMACADHYSINTLRDAISNHLRDTISTETACTVLVAAQTYGQEQTFEKYLSFILTHAQQVTRTEGFLNLDINVLMKVLEADEARIEEVDLFKALVRWYRHWAKDPEVELDPQLAERLFGSVRYASMTGEQLVTEVRPLAGEIVPQELYVRALEQVAAPNITAIEEASKQSGRRHPPVCTVHVSDPILMVHSTSVRKVGSVPAEWRGTAVIEPSTSCTKVKIENLPEPSNGIGLAIFDPERLFLRGSGNGFPNPNQWGADCLVGIYGTGCFFGIHTESVLQWHVGLTVVIRMSPQPDGHLHVSFTTEGKDSSQISAEGLLSVPHDVKLAIALFTPEDQVSIEPAW